jgi:hypothetical protein
MRWFERNQLTALERERNRLRRENADLMPALQLVAQRVESALRCIALQKNRRREAAIIHRAWKAACGKGREGGPMAFLAAATTTSQNSREYARASGVLAVHH